MRLGHRTPASANPAFLQCTNCKKTLFQREFEQNFWVCPHCGHGHRLTAIMRLGITVDEGSFVELDTDLLSVDSLHFPDYADKLAQAVAKSGRNEGLVSGTATIEGTPIAIAVADFTFMGGSMGSVAGEKIARTLERAAVSQMPAVVFCASGGARMQEGLFSLMQLAKTNAAVHRCRQSGAPYIAIFTDPTMAGVLASYASVADIILAEPKAQVGFAGARVSKQAGVGKVPDDFQTAEYAYRHGMVDRIVPRRDLRDTLAALCRMLGGSNGHA